jgi:hypothetical protein
MDRPSFPLIVHDDERAVLRTALHAFRDDLGHEEHRVSAVVDGVLARVPDDEATPLRLDAADMLNGTSRGQDEERGHLRALLDRLPGEHDVRAIDLDTELARRG